MIATEFLIELILIVLLVMACLYGFILNRRLSLLRKGQEELVVMIEQFDQSTKLAQENLSTMQARGITLERDLGQKVARANLLIDELSVMVNAGDNIAGRIEGVVAQVRSIGTRNKSQERLNG